MFAVFALGVIGAALHDNERAKNRRRAERAAEEARRQAEEAKAAQRLAEARAAEAKRVADAAAAERRKAAEEAERRRQRAAAEAAERKRAEQEREAAEKAARVAEEARRAAEERWRRGVPPNFAPTRAEVDAVRARYQWVRGFHHVAITGRSGTGKSSLVNALRGLSDQSSNAALTGVVETTTVVGRYLDPHNDHRIWYDVPGAGTAAISDWQYFKEQGLYAFDAIVVLFGDRLTLTDIAILKTCRACNIPTLIVRSKSDQYIRNVMQDDGYSEDDGGDSDGYAKALAAATAKYIETTRKSVSDNLEQAGLANQKVHIVSKGILKRIVGRQAPRGAIDEVELLEGISQSRVN